MLPYRKYIEALIRTGKIVEASGSINNNNIIKYYY